MTLSPEEPAQYVSNNVTVLDMSKSTVKIMSTHSHIHTYACIYDTAQLQLRLHAWTRVAPSGILRVKCQSFPWKILFTRYGT